MSDILIDILNRCRDAHAAEKKFDSCFVKRGDIVTLTNKLGELVGDATWRSMPFILSNLFVQKERDIWAISGQKLDWAGDKIVWLSHMWICTSVYDQLVLGRIKQFGEKFIVDDNMLIEEFGYCDYNGVVYKKGGIWRRSLYAGGYIDSSAEFKASEADTDEMIRGGATKRFMSSVGLRGGIASEEQKESVYRMGASSAYKLLLECMSGKIAEAISPVTGVPLDVIQLCIDCLGSRKSFLSEVITEG